MAAGLRFDRRVQILRAPVSDDGMTMVRGAPAVLFTMPAARRDVSDGERFRAGETLAELSARFTLRADSRSRTILHSDQLRDGAAGPVYQIIVVKSVRDGALIEITCGRVVP